MPAFDLPLEELRTYTGTNPRPEDFEAYWSTALAELDDVSADVQLDRVDHPAGYAECFDLWFT